MPTGFHSHAHLHSLGCEIAVELLRFLAVLQSLLSTISRFRIHKRNLLEARVVICSYNDHGPAPFYPSLWLVATTKVYSGLGAGVVMESIAPQPQNGVSHFASRRPTPSWELDRECCSVSDKWRLCGVVR